MAVESKQCRKCLEAHPLTEYFPNGVVCKPCQRRKRNETQRAWHAARGTHGRTGDNVKERYYVLKVERDELQEMVNVLMVAAYLTTTGHPIDFNLDKDPSHEP